MPNKTNQEMFTRLGCACTSCLLEKIPWPADMDASMIACGCRPMVEGVQLPSWLKNLLDLAWHQDKAMRSSIDTIVSTLDAQLTAARALWGQVPRSDCKQALIKPLDNNPNKKQVAKNGVVNADG